MPESLYFNMEAKRPPLVKGLPVLGSALPLMKNPHDFVSKAYQQYGDVFRFEAGPRKFVVMAGVDANRFVSGEGKHLFSVDGFWGEMGRKIDCPHMLVMVDGEIHQYQRRLMGPLLTQQAQRHRLEAMSSTVRKMMADYVVAQRFPFGEFARQMMSNQLSQTFQGYRASHQKVEQLIYWFSAITKVYGLRSWPRWMLSTPPVRFSEWQSRRLIRKAVQVSRQRIRSGNANPDYYLDTLIPRLESKPDWFSEGDIEAHALLLFVAALDTIAASKGFAIYRLLQDERLYQRVQAEVDAVFSQGTPDLATLKCMEDLNGLWREVLRVQPTAFGISRRAVSDFEFKGYRIKKGEDVMIFTTADHNNPLYFPEPQRFEIERYREPRNEHKQPAYAPFGKGPHNCIGASLTELILPLHLGLMLYHLKFTADCRLDKVRVRFNPAPVLSDNFRVKVELRHPLKVD